MNEKNITTVRHLFEIYFDVQDVRIRSFNRLRQVWWREKYREKHGHFPLGNAREQQAELSKFRREVNSKEAEKLIKEFIAATGIRPEELKNLEKQIRDYIKEEIKELPIVQTYLRGIKGIGPILAGGIVSWFDPAEAPHISSFWKYAGLHVQDGSAVKRRKGEKLDFNLKVRTFCWKLADSFIKQRTEPYRDLYDQAKREEAAKLGNPENTPETCPSYRECTQRLKTVAKRKGASTKKLPCKMHIHRRAARKMVKRFLADLWLVWRKLENLPTSEPYAVAILHHDSRDQIPFEQTRRR